MLRVTGVIWHSPPACRRMTGTPSRPASCDFGGENDTCGRTGPADRPPRGRPGVGGRHRLGGAAGGHMLRVHRTATVNAVSSRAIASGDRRQHAIAAEQVIAPLCIVAAGAAFVAEVIVGSDAATFGALSVVPVLAASLLRSRPLTLVVAAFAMLLQVCDVG